MHNLRFGLHAWLGVRLLLHVWLCKAVEKGLNLVQNLSEVWGSSDYAMKQALQYLIFPEGILYNKEKDTVRTNKINLLFASISGLARVLTENKKDNLLQDCLFGSNVGMAGQISNHFIGDLQKLAAFLSQSR